MARKKKTHIQRPLINLVLIMFFGLAMYDSAGMAFRSFSEGTARAAIAALYFIGALASFIALLCNQRKTWLWLLVAALLGSGLAYLIKLQAIVWIIGISVMLVLWVKSDNRKWHKLRF
ncbi:hypothetical protein ACFLQY_03575 [Verrucomicrobiota bacterium]